MASSTARVLIADSLRSLGVLATGETPSAAEANDGLMLLNEMLELWNLQSLLVYSFVRTVQSTVASQAAYTLGAGGDWNMTRPDRIERMTHYDSVQDLELPMTEMSEREFQDLQTKGTTSTIPAFWYDNRAYPLRSITLYPVPSTNSQVYLYTWQQLSTVSTLDTVLDFPSGYRAAIRYNLAMHAAVDFGVDLTEALVLRAREAMSVLKQSNTVTEPLETDVALRRGGGDFDAVLGAYRW